MSVVNRIRPRKYASSTLLALRGTFRRRDTTVVFTVVALAYALIYLWAIGDVRFTPTSGIAVDVVASPGRALQSGPGRFSFEGIAIVDLAVARYILSPLNTTIGLVLGAMVGANLALSYLAVVRPASCGIGASSGLLASVPAVPSGGACCAPVILIVLGITASGAMITAITWLLPVSLVLLVLTFVYLAGQIDTTALRE